MYIVYCILIVIQNNCTYSKFKQSMFIVSICNRLLKIIIPFSYYKYISKICRLYVYIITVECRSSQDTETFIFKSVINVV